MSDTMTPAAAILTAAFSSPAPAAPPATPAPPNTAPPAHPSGSPPGPQGEITLAQATKMVDWIREDFATGKMTEAQANQALDDLHVPLDQRTPPADLRTDEQKLIDQQFPVARPEEYRIPYASPGQPWPEMTPALKQFDESSRSWLVAAGFPAHLGNALITNISKVAQATQSMTPDQLESYRMVEHEKMQRAHGEKLGERLQAADDMIDWLEDQRPGLINLLGSKGIGRNAMVWNMLIGQAERWHARRKGR